MKQLGLLSGRAVITVGFALLLIVSAPYAISQETAAPPVAPQSVATEGTTPSEPETAPAPVTETQPETQTPPPKPRRINREKEAEGSEAKNRFTQDPVVKSQYRIRGQALEVDPD